MKDIWVPVSGQIAQQRQVDTIANNIANANTKGFKKDDIVFREYITALDKGIDHIDLPNKEWSPKDFYHSHGAENAKVKVDGSFTDFSQGQLEPTQNPLDLAIKGKGFFEVLTPRGIRYTRNGSFTISKDGLLVNSQGFQLLQSAKEEDSPEEGAEQKEAPSLEERFISIPQGVANIQFSKEGFIFLDGAKLAQVSVKEFKDLHAIKKEGSNLYQNNAKDNLVNANSSTIHQGFQEGSNVNTINEMAKLIQAHRTFENIQKAIKIYDGINGKLINDLGRY